MALWHAVMVGDQRRFGDRGWELLSGTSCAVRTMRRPGRQKQEAAHACLRQRAEAVAITPRAKTQ